MNNRETREYYKGFIRGVIEFYEKAASPALEDIRDILIEEAIEDVITEITNQKGDK